MATPHPITLGQEKHSGVKRFTLDSLAAVHIPPASGRDPPPPKHQLETNMTKTLIAALILASAALGLTSQANAGPDKPQTPTGEVSWMDRASTNYDGGGY